MQLWHFQECRFCTHAHTHIPSHTDTHTHIYAQVILSVGGCKFTTTLSTLRNAPESLFNAMFSGRHELKTDDQGCFFIDRRARVCVCVSVCVCMVCLYGVFMRASAYFERNLCISLDLASR
jgi:hypothetical protein